MNILPDVIFHSLRSIHKGGAGTLVMSGGATPGTKTTPNSPAAWRPDVTTYLPSDVVPDAVIVQTATIVGRIEGDEPAVRIPYAASSPIRPARSEDAFFSSDVTAIRVTWRLGWSVMHAERVIKLTVTATP